MTSLRPCRRPCPRTLSRHAVVCAAIALAAACLAFSPQNAAAMSVSPVYLDMTSAGPRSRADIRISNPSDGPMPIEPVILRMRHDVNGAPVFEPDDADFLILPMQVIIPPRGSQVLKVQWLGEPMIEESRAYQISVNQLPVAQPDGSKSVQLLVNFGVIVTVAPPQGTPDLQLVRSEVTRTRSGSRAPTLTVTNRSRVHARLPDASITLSAGGWSAQVNAGVLTSAIGIGVVMPGQTRSFTLPISLPDGVDAVEARLDYRAPARR